MPIKNTDNWLRFILFFLLLLPCMAFPRSLEEIKKSGKLYVGLIPGDYETINYPLVKEFARYLNVKLVDVTIQWEDVFSHKGIIPEGVETNPNLKYTPDIFNKVDLVSSTFTILEWRKKLFDLAETLYSTELLVVHKNSVVPENFEGLRDKAIAFLKETSYEIHLKKINEQINGTIHLKGYSDHRAVSNALVNGEVYGIVLDADEALLFKSNHENFKIAFPISEVKKSAWAVEKGNKLKNEIEKFFEVITANGILDKIFTQFYNEPYSAFVNKIRKKSTLTVYHRDLEDILESKKLVVAFREKPFIFDESKKQFMHTLAQEFANYLGVKLEYVITPYPDKYWETPNGKIHRDSSYTPEWFNYFDLACDMFVPRDWMQNKAFFVTIYPSEYTIIAKKETPVARLSDLKKLTGVVSKKSVYENILLKNGIKKLIHEHEDNFIREIMTGKADYTLIYNAFFQLSDYPELEIKIPMGSADVCWATRKGQPALTAELKKFIQRSKEDGLVNLLMMSLQPESSTMNEDVLTAYYASLQIGQLPYVSYGTKEGFPKSAIHSIYQDNKRYMWFGTESGAAKYNGREMEIFNTYDGLGNNKVSCIRQDLNGLLYFATRNGISVFENNKITHNLFPEFEFTNIFIDSQNNKWFLGKNGIYLLDGKNNRVNFNNRFPILPEIIHDVDEDGTGMHKFIATSEGIFYYSENNEVIYRVTNEECFSILADERGKIWFSTREGLFRADLINIKKRDTRSFERMDKFLDTRGKIIREITRNNYGIVWLRTDDKIIQVFSKDQNAIVYEQKDNSKNIVSFHEDIEGNVWIGFEQGLQRFTRRTGLRVFYPDHVNYPVNSIFQDNIGRVWYCTENGVYYYDDNLVSFLPGEKWPGSFHGTELADGNILLVNNGLSRLVNPELLAQVHSSRVPAEIINIYSRDQQIFYLTTKGTYLQSNYKASPRLIHPANIDNLSVYKNNIIGSWKNKLLLFNSESQSFENFREIDHEIKCLLENENKLWIGTTLELFYLQDGQLIKVSLGQENENVQANCIYPAKNKEYLWIGSNKGLFYMHKESLKIDFILNMNDGLPSDEILPNGLFIDNNDLLWIGTPRGIANFNIRARTREHFTPLCNIENILVNGQPVLLSRSVFNENENNFVFEVSGLSFMDENSVEYEFYLRGLENEYVSRYIGPDYKALYHNLPPGKYEFVYRARGKNNIWGYSQKHEFVIRQTWYKTWWFMGIMGTIVLAVLLSLHHAKINRLKKENRKIKNELEMKN